MKRRVFLKRAVSLAMVSAMALSAAMVAPFAASADGDYSITIKPTPNTNTNKKYSAYQIFTGALETGESENTTIDPEKIRMSKSFFESVYDYVDTQLEEYPGITDYSDLKEALGEDPTYGEELINYFIASVKNYGDRAEAWTAYDTKMNEENPSRTMRSIEWGTSVYKTGVNKVEELLAAYALYNWNGDATSPEYASGTSGAITPGNSYYEAAFGQIYNSYLTAKEEDEAKALKTSAKEVATVLSGSFKVEGYTAGEWEIAQSQIFAKLSYDVVQNYPTKSGVEYDSDADCWTITGLDAGYYLVADTTGSWEGDSVAPFVLDVAQNVTCYVKSDTPKVDKTITGVKDVDSTNKTDSNVSEDGTSAVAGIGDTISYQLEGTLPSNMDDYYEFFYYQFYDTLSEGLTLDKSSVKVNFVIGDVTVPVYWAGGKGDDYKYGIVKDPFANILDNTAKNGTDAYNFSALVYDQVADSGDVLVVTFSDLYAVFEQLDGKTLTGDTGSVKFDFAKVDWSTVKVQVTYDAVLNSDAEVGTDANQNVVHLTYTNDPNGNYDGSAEPGSPDDPTPPPPDHPENPDNPDDPYEPEDPGEPDDPTTPPGDPEDPENPNTPPPGTSWSKDKAIVVTFEIDVDKQDSVTKSALENAGFSVQKTDADGKYAVFYFDGSAYKLVGWTETPWGDGNTADTPDEDAKEAAGAFASANTSSLKKILNVEDLPEELDTQLVTQVKTKLVDEKAVFNVIGLDAGTYYFTETNVPDGYVAVDPFTVKLVAEKAEDGNYTGKLVKNTSATAGTTVTGDEINGSATLVETNLNAGKAEVLVLDDMATLLPSTGGAGKYFYYAGGVVFLALGVGTLKLAKKKKGNNFAV